jgi:Ni,Fe-hydrogenase III large subunit/Ni,Fe-hydrogenase III component G
MTQLQALRERCREAGMLLQPPALNQLHVRVDDDGALLALGTDLRELGCHLVTLAGNDERELIDNCFTLTYLFSHPDEDLFLFVENPLNSNKYTSLYHLFPVLDPFERELADLMGLFPSNDGQPREVSPGSWLHDCYPLGLHPLRRELPMAAIRTMINRHRCQGDEPDHQLPGDGEWLLPVGPIHAGIIEPGRFLFRLAGEVVEELRIHLGYTHKGIERLFQTAYRLADGWQLAEHVSGDSAFAHSLAYCQAAEALGGVPPPEPAMVLRGILLELERMANHIGDCAALAHDVALDLPAAELSALRELLMRLNQQVTGHRLLRGLNRPGGIQLPHPLDAGAVQATVAHVASEFATLGTELAQSPAVRDRLQWIGILTRLQAQDLGVTGLVARASGIARDCRLLHPPRPYQDRAVRRLVERGMPPTRDPIQAREATAGDCLARLLARIREVEAAAGLIAHFASHSTLDSGEARYLAPIEFGPRQNYRFGLGIVEGWRGDIVYWLMQDKFGRIFRCKVRDPSMLNWPALKAAVEPHRLDEAYTRLHRPPGREAESILPDFPIINKSFNLSYSGNDL